MKLYIEQTDIEKEITEAVVTDSAGGQADSLRVTPAGCLTNGISGRGCESR